MQRVGVLAFVLIAVLTSCTKGDEQTKGEQHGTGEHGMTRDCTFTLPQGNATEGRKVFVEAECFKCHEVKGETFPAAAEKDKGVGPELSQMAGMHPPEFFAESI
ncbi:MAG: c-type cytochrome, partial [Candidatus Binatia bacterium]